MELQLIDFQARFTQDYFSWCKDHPEILEDEEKADDLYFDMLEGWLDQPMKWLGGKSPNAYFDAVKEPEMLVSMLIEYEKAEIELPDPLFRRLLEEKEKVYPMLCHILFANESQDMEREELLDVQAGVISLLTEMELPHPLERYAEKLIHLEEDCAYAEEAAEALGDAGEEAREILLKAYPASRGYGRKCFIDLLSSLSPSDDIREILLDEFAKPDADRAFLAECLGRYGDPAALPVLRRAMEEPELEYYVFLELKNAAEQLSGEEIADRDFSGDKLYDLLSAQDAGEVPHGK